MIYDIFQTKNKKKEMKKIKIITDIHEKNSLVLSELFADKEIELEIKSLEIGDYLINETILERKTFLDFISSMLNKRLVQQLRNMQKYKSRVLILEGQNFEILKETKINPNALRGMILSILLDFQIPIIFTKNEEDTAKFIVTLAKRQFKGKSEITLHSRKPLTKDEQKQYIIESFPNIGPKNAKKLLKKFNSIKNIINANPEELKSVIGEKANSILNLRD